MTDKNPTKAEDSSTGPSSWRLQTRSRPPNGLAIIRFHCFRICLVSDRLSVLPQYLYPKHAMTAVAGRLAKAKAGGATTAFIRWFVGHYGVNMSEAAEP